MKLTVGETWHKEKENYREQLTVEGLDSIDNFTPKGDVVVPRGPNSHIEVRIINDISAKFYNTTIKLKHLVNQWERGEIEIEGLAQ
jgi:hypothetical protein